MNQNLDHKKFQISYMHLYFTLILTRTLFRSKFRSMHVTTYQLYILKLNLKLDFRFEDPSIHHMY